jgi:hypothetical protein
MKGKNLIAYAYNTWNELWGFLIIIEINPLLVVYTLSLSFLMQAG